LREEAPIGGLGPVTRELPAARAHEAEDLVGRLDEGRLARELEPPELLVDEIVEPPPEADEPPARRLKLRQLSVEALDRRGLGRERPVEDGQQAPGAGLLLHGAALAEDDAVEVGEQGVEAARADLLGVRRHTPAEGSTRREEQRGVE